MVQLGAGQSFAEYTLDGVLGQGGMGSVYLAHHPRLPRQVALKLLGNEVSADPELRKRFEQEANAIARLDHPNIVGIHDRGVHDGHLWIAMQYVQGIDASRLDPRQVSVERALRIITETASALDFAHSRGVLHRDVKPANILLSAADTGREERAILTDFGIARLLDSNTQLTSTGMFTATLAYASPEQLSGEQVDHRSDQYSLACTLFTLLAGHPPFPAGNPGQVVAAHLSQPLPRLSHIRNDVPTHLDDVIARATAKRREDRFTNCTEFASAAAGASSGQPLFPASRSAPTVVAQQGFSASPPAWSMNAVDRGPNAEQPGGGLRRVLGWLLLLIACLVTLSCFTTFISGNDDGDLNRWDAWRYVRSVTKDSSSVELTSVHLLGGALVLCALLAGAAGAIALIKGSTRRPAAWWFGAVASGVAFGVTATAIVDMVSIVEEDGPLSAVSPGPGFWLLLAAAVAASAAMFCCISAASKAAAVEAVPRNPRSLAAGSLLLMAALAVLGASFMDLYAFGHIGFPAQAWVTGKFQLPRATLIAAAVLGTVGALFLVIGRGTRTLTHSIATVCAALVLAVALTSGLEVLSDIVLFGAPRFSRLASGFWVLITSIPLSLVALIAIRTAVRRNVSE